MPHKAPGDSVLMMEEEDGKPWKGTFYYFAVDLRLVSQQVTAIALDARTGSTGL